MDNKKLNDANVVPTEFAQSLVAAEPMAPMTEPLPQPELPQAEQAPKKKIAKVRRPGEVDTDEESAEEGGDTSGAAGTSGDDSSQLLAQAQQQPQAGAKPEGEKPAAEGADADKAKGAEAGAEGAEAMSPAVVGGGAAAAGLAAAGGGGGGGGAAAGAVVVSSSVPAASVSSGGGFAGIVADGYIKNAQLFIDKNGNGKPDAGEEAKDAAGNNIFTDANGNFSLTSTPTGTIMAVGGTNIDTGLANTVILKAPAGSTVINPLTTVLQEYIETKGVTLAQAQADVKAALGLPAGLDLTTYDPLGEAPTDANALAAQKAAAQIAAILTLAEGDTAGAGATMLDNLIGALDPNTPIDLTDTATIADLASGLGLEPTTLTQIENINTAINSATTLATDGAGSLSDVQEVFLNTTDDAPVFLSGMTGTHAVLENAGGPEVVYTAKATDPEGGTVTYSLSDDAGGLFVIDSVTGEVSTNDSLDFETQSSHVIQVTASDGTLSTTQSVTIMVGNQNEAPSITSGTTGSVLENGEAGFDVVYTATATDPDADAALTFSLSSNPDNAFSINAQTGEVTALSSFDYESRSEFQIQISVTDGVNPAATQDVTIFVQDENEPVAFTSNDTTTPLLENSETGNVVYTAAAADPESGSGSILYSLDNDAEGRFAIDGSTGVVTNIRDDFNFETASSYDIVIKATDGVTEATKTVTIQVGDVAEAPFFPNTDAVEFTSIFENNAAGAFIFDAHVIDEDTAHGDVITYSLVDDFGGKFAIDGEGRITATRGLDYEDATNYSIEVHANDSTGRAATKTVALLIDNVPEAMGFQSEPTGTILENKGIGSPLSYVANATGDGVGDVTYTLVDGGDDNAFFEINSSTGQLTAASDFNFEERSTYQVEVQATDGVQTTTQVVTISVLDKDEAPEFTGDSATLTVDNVPENIAVPVFSLAGVTDPEGDAISFRLEGVDAAYFNIGEDGNVSYNGGGDYETHSALNVDVVASDGTNETLHSLTINLADMNDAPVFTTGASGEVIENAAPGTTVFDVNAMDPDGSSITFSMAGEFGFSIDSNTGVITTGDHQFNFETDPSTVELFVTAADATGATSYQTVTMHLGNANDAPSFGEQGHEATVFENEPGPRTIATFAATDEDGDALTYTLSGEDSTSFHMASDGGLVTDAPFNYEFRSTMNVTVNAHDASGANAQHVLTVNVTDVDEAPIFLESPTATTQFAENETGSVYTISAFDPDHASDVTFSLISGDERFSIDGATGEVSLNAPLDYESAPDLTGDHPGHYDLVIRANDGAGNFTDQMLTVYVGDEQESPQFSSHTLTINVTENDGPGTIISDGEGVSDPDIGDTLSFHISGPESAGFEINSTTGELSIASTLSADVDDMREFGITVTDSDGNQDIQLVTVHIANSPALWTSGTTTEVDENVTGVQVYDAELSFDGGADPEDTVFTLLPGSDGFSIDAETGVVTVTTGFDRELVSQAQFTVQAASASSAYAPITRTVTVAIGDENEYAPSFVDGSSRVMHFTETDQYGEVMGIISSTDQDATAQLTYTLSGDFYQSFALRDPEGGPAHHKELVLNSGQADADMHGEYHLTVGISDGSHATVYQTVTVVIDNIDDEAPQFVTGSTSFVVEENTSLGTVVYSPNAQDVDSEGPLTYSIVEGSTAFGIDAETGNVTVAAWLDAENPSQGSYNFTINVTDGLGHSNQQAVHIDVGNVNDNTPYLTTGDIWHFNEHSNASLPVADIGATDGDHQNDLTFSLNPTVGDAEMFSIDPATGELYIDDPAHYPWQSAYHVQVMVNDGAGATHAATQNVTLHVDPVAEAMAVMPTETGDSSGDVYLWQHDAHLAPAEAWIPDTADYIEVAGDSSLVGQGGVGVSIDGFNYVAVLSSFGMMTIDMDMGNDPATVFSSLENMQSAATQVVDFWWSNNGNHDAIVGFQFGGDTYIWTDHDGPGAGEPSYVKIMGADVTQLRYDALDHSRLTVQTEADLVAVMPSDPEVPSEVADAGAYDWRFAPGADYIAVDEGSSVAGARSMWITSLDGFTVETPFQAFIDAHGMIDVDETGNQFVDDVITGSNLDHGLDAVVAIADQLLGQNEIAAFHFDDGNSYVVTDTDGVNDQVLAGVILQNMEVTAVTLSTIDPNQLWLQQEHVV